MTGPPHLLKSAQKARSFDAWHWYGEAMRPWPAFLIPILLLPVPALLFLLVHPAWSAFWRMLTVTTTLALNLDAGIVLGFTFGYEWWLTWLAATWAQLLFLSWMLRNIEFVRRWGPLDRFFSRRERKARAEYERHHWIRKFHFWGIFVFTFLPLGSGVVVGLLLGKITGMETRRLWLAVYAGTLTWALLLLYLVGLGVDWVEQWLDGRSAH